MSGKNKYSKSDLGALIIAGFFTMLANSFEFDHGAKGFNWVEYVVVIAVAVISYWFAKKILGRIFKDTDVH